MTRLMAVRDLRLLLLAGLVSQAGDWMLSTAVAYQVYAVTGSPVASSLAFFSAVAPQVLLGSVAGVFVDRWDRRRVMVAVNLALAAVLLPLTVPAGAGQVAVILAVVGISGCLAPFFVAAEATMLPALVTDPGRRVTANALNGQVRNVARLLGGAAGGTLVAVGGLPLVAVVDTVSFVLAAAAIAAIRFRPVVARTLGPRFRAEWAAGLRTIMADARLRVVLVFLALTGLGEGVMGALIAPFASDVLHGSATTYGSLMAAQAVGGITGGFLVTAVGHRLRPRTLLGGGAMIFGALDLAMFVYPLAWPHPWPALALIAVVGLPAAAMAAGLMTVFQTATADENRGRVFGALMTVQNAAMLTASLIAGPLAEAVGIVAVIAVQGVLPMVAGAVVLRRLRRSSTPAIAARATVLA